MTSAPLISIIVVNFNGGEKLRERLFFLLNDQLSPPFEILFVDNASEDGSGHIGSTLAKQFQNFHYLQCDKNLGYSGGINRALPYAQGDYIAVLNMDIRVSPGWLAPVLSFLKTNPHAGAVNPLILLEKDHHQVNAVGQSVHITALGFNRALGQALEEIGDQPVDVSGLHGSAFVIRKQLLEEMGGLDEGGFLYHEDVDLSWLLLIKGYSLYCIPESIVYHDYHLTMYPEKLYLLERNRLAMLLAYLQPKTIVFIMPWLLMTEGMLWAYCLLRGLKFLQAKFAAYRWVFSQIEHISTRRRRVEEQRRRSDMQVLRMLNWGYAWDQFITLGRERGVSRRQPIGGLPVDFS